MFDVALSILDAPLLMCLYCSPKPKVVNTLRDILWLSLTLSKTPSGLQLSLWPLSLWWILVLLSLLAYCYQWLHLFRIWLAPSQFITQTPIGYFRFRCDSVSKFTPLRGSSSRQLPYVPPIRSLHPYFKMLVLWLVSAHYIGALLLTLIRVFNAHKYGSQRRRCSDGCKCRFQITFVPFDNA